MKIMLKNLRMIFNVNLWQDLKIKEAGDFLVNWIYKYNLIYFKLYA